MLKKMEHKRLMRVAAKSACCLLSLASLSGCHLFKHKVTEAGDKTIVFVDDSGERITFTRQRNDIAIVSRCKDGNQDHSCTLPEKISVDDFRFLLKQALRLQGNYHTDVQKNIDTYKKVTNISSTLSVEELRDMALHDRQNLVAVLAFAEEHKDGITSSDSSDVQEFIKLLRANKVTVDVNDIKAIKDINVRIDKIVDMALDSITTYIVSSKNPDTNFEYNILKALVDPYKTVIQEKDWIPVQQGKFTMGSPPDEKGRDPDEDEYEVVVNYDFDMMKYTVTQEQFVKVFGYNNSEHQLKKYCEKSFVQKGKVTYCADLPVTNVMHDEAKQFALRMSEKTRKKIRLPTEREWEYAARGGHQAPIKKQTYISGSLDELKNYAVYDENPNHPYSNKGQPLPVGSRLPNILGLYDISGNVWQWTDTKYGSYPNGRVVGRDQEPTSGPYFVMRGGSWFNGALDLRLASRSNSEPTGSDPFLGFRLVREK